MAEGDSNNRAIGSKEGHLNREIHWQEKLAERPSKNRLETYESVESDRERCMQTRL